MKIVSSSTRWMLFSLPLLFLLLFFFYPLLRILLLSFFPETGLGSGGIEKLTDPLYLKIVWFTFWQAGLSTILTLILALPGAYIFAHYQFPGKNIIHSLLTVPFVLPTVVVAAAFRALLGKGGLLNSLLLGTGLFETPPLQIEQTMFFFLLAHIFYNYALVLRIVGGFWAGIDQKVTAAARLLGATPWRAFWKVSFPLLLPAIGSAALLVFIFCFTSFGVILILGGPGYATIEVEIYRQAIQLFNLPMAASLSLIQIFINLLLMWLHAHLSKRAKLSFFADIISSAIPPRRIKEKVLIVTTLLFMVLLLASPLAALLAQSLIGESGPTLRYYTALFSNENSSMFFVEPIKAVINSIGFGLCAMAVAVILGTISAIFLASQETKASSVWDSLIMLPLATSAVTLGFGYIISLNTPPLNLRDSLIIVILAHTLVALPFVVRCVLPTLRHIPPRLREAATLLGASPGQVWKNVDFPLSSRAILVGGIFAFSISMGEFGASAFVTRPHTPTMPVAIFRFLGQPGEMNYGQAMAMSTVLMLVTCITFWIMGKFDKGEKTLLHTPNEPS